MSPIPTSEFPHPYALVKKKMTQVRKGPANCQGFMPTGH